MVIHFYGEFHQDSTVISLQKIPVVYKNVIYLYLIGHLPFKLRVQEPKENNI